MNRRPKHSTTLGVDSFQDLLHTLSQATAPLQALHQQAVKALAPTVQEIVRSGSRDSPWIERSLDQLLNHAGTPEGLALFKTLCRAYWTLDPQATASYINAYREMWDSDDKNDTEEVGLNSYKISVKEWVTDHNIKRLAS